MTKTVIGIIDWYLRSDLLYIGQMVTLNLNMEQSRFIDCLQMRSLTMILPMTYGSLGLALKRPLELVKDG